MAYTTASFAISQGTLTPNIVTVTNNSTGSAGTITNWKIYVTDSANNPIVPSGTTTSYIQVPIATLYVDLDILTTDKACTIRVDFCNVSGVVVQTVTNVFVFTEYSKQFFYYLFQNQALTPSLPQTTNYYNNTTIYWTNIQGALNAIAFGADVNNSQNCINRLNYMRANENNFF